MRGRKVPGKRGPADAAAAARPGWPWLAVWGVGGDAPPGGLTTRFPSGGGSATERRWPMRSGSRGACRYAWLRALFNTFRTPAHMY